MTRLLTGSVLGAIAFGSLALFSSVQAQEGPVFDPAAVARDARRVEDLQHIKKGLDTYVTRYWSYRRYDILSPAISDNYWRNSGSSRDFRKRMRDIVNQLPVDPWNDPLLGFRYVYAYAPLDYGDAPDCAGKIILYAARVETAAAHYQECDLGEGERILYVIASEPMVAASYGMLAGALSPLLKLFSFAY